MFERLRFWIWYKLAYIVAGMVMYELIIGGNCGLCGKWVEHELIPRNWPYTICRDCKG